MYYSYAINYLDMASKLDDVVITLIGNGDYDEIAFVVVKGIANAVTGVALLDDKISISDALGGINSRQIEGILKDEYPGVGGLDTRQEFNKIMDLFRKEDEVEKDMVYNALEMFKLSIPIIKAFLSYAKVKFKEVSKDREEYFRFFADRFKEVGSK